MPRLDGYEAPPTLLARRPGLPIVLCTGYVDDEVGRRSAAVGFATVLSKDQSRKSSP